MPEAPVVTRARAGAVTGSAKGLRQRSTPAKLRGLLAVLVAAATLLWISATILLNGLHSTAVSVRGTAYPALLDVIEAGATLSDADRAAWQSFRSGEAQLTGPGHLYQNDITNAGQDLQRFASLQPSGSAGSQELQTISGQLVTYQGLVEQADASYRTEIALGTASHHRLGYAYLTYASGSMRSPQGGLLASVGKLSAADRNALRRQLASPWADPALFLVLAVAGLLGLASIIVAQRFLRRQFRRAISPPLLSAAVLVCALVAWMAVVIFPADAALATARSAALPKLTQIWLEQTRAVDAEAKALRVNTAGNASGAASGGLTVTSAQPASTALDADLASAEKMGGLPAGIPVMAALIACLAWLGIKSRLDEYRA